MTHKMTGALIAGVCAWCLGGLGVVIGLALALVYYSRTKD